MPRRITLLIPLFLLASAPAYALDVGQCDAPDSLYAKITAEGHQTIAQMDRIGVSVERNGRHDVAEFITATPDLKRWYLVSGDEPLSKRSSRMCVEMAGRNLEVNDYRKDAPPTVTSYTFDTKKALSECKYIETYNTLVTFNIDGRDVEIKQGKLYELSKKRAAELQQQIDEAKQRGASADEIAPLEATLRQVAIVRDDSNPALGPFERNVRRDDSIPESCHEFNETLRDHGRTFNERIALQGVTDQNTLMTISANPDASKPVANTGIRNFHTLAVAPAGATMISGKGHNFSFSAWALGVLDRIAATQSKTN